MLATFARVASLILALTFAWAALAKAARPARWRDALRHYRLGPLERVASFGVPVAEAGVAALLALGRDRVGAALALALVSGFSVVVMRARLERGSRLPCGCFGGTRARDYRSMLARNGLLGTLAAFVLLLGAVEGAAAPGGADMLPAALVGVGIAVGCWLVWQTSTSLRRR
jgi:hypothetical protein